MLEWFWFAALSLFGIALALRSVALERNETADDGGSWAMQFQLGSHGSLACALAASSDATIEPAYAWLRNVLPEHATHINQLTAVALTGLGAIAFVFVMPFVIMMAEYARRETSAASKVAKAAISRARALRR